MFGPGAIATVLGVASLVRHPLAQVLPLAAIILAIPTQRASRGSYNVCRSDPALRAAQFWERAPIANASVVGFTKPDSNVRLGSRAVKLVMSIFLLKCPGLRTFVASVANPILLRPTFRCRERQLRCDSSSHTG
jgi:hypothetical protein